MMQGRILEELVVIISHETNATGAGGNDKIRACEVFEKFGTNSPGFIPEACIKSGLTTTGLVIIIGDRTTCFLQHFDHVESRIRIELIYKAGNKQLNVHRELCVLIFKRPLQ